ncbi:hypothetical protein [Undibacterium sp. Di24W]
MVAHRPETINATERMVMLKDGQAVEVHAAIDNVTVSNVGGLVKTFEAA